VPTERANLVIDLQYPTGVNCDDVQTWLLKVDTAGGPSWSYTLLFDAAHEIYGCGGTAAPCNPAPALYGMDLLGAKKVELEGLTAMPSVWVATTSTSAGLQVVCRGIADASVIPGSIAIASASPTPAPQPTAVPVDVTVHLQVMRVGASNTVFGTLPPDRLWAAAASLSSARFGFDDGQGRILLAGGSPDSSAANPQAGMYSFSPQTLTFSSAGTLSSARAGLSATATLFGGQPAVVFAGGGGGANGSVASTDVDVVFADGTIHPMALPQPRSYHSAVYLDGGGAAPVIAIAGGAHLVGGTPVAQWTSPGDTTMEVIVPAGSGSTVCGGDGTTCGLAASTGGRGLAAVERISGVPDSLFIGGGTGANATWETAPSSTLIPSSTSPLTGALPYIASATAVIDSAGNPDLDGKPLIFGGSSGDDPFANASVSTVSQFRGSSVALLATTLNPKRAFLTATTLRDHTILLAGGMNTTNGTNHPATSTLERFRPQFVTAGNTQTGVVEALPGGPALVAARFAHTATRIEGSRTWLDGAVLIAGGAQSSSTLPELFVPSYKCDSAGQPVSEAVTSTGIPLALDPGSNPALPQPCDRGRVKEPITDPVSGASFLP
jgi:hypothetical protein